MAGFDNEVMYSTGVRLEASDSQAIFLMQQVSTDVSHVNHTGSPNGAVAANPSSLSHDPVAGNLWLKVTGTGNTGWQLIAFGTFVQSVSGTLNRITSTGGQNPVIDIAATYVGQTSITTLGTITTGTWQGTTVAATFGGTGQNTYATGDILYASAVNTLSKLPASTNGFVLTLSAGIPAWVAPSGGTVTSVTGTLNRITVTNPTTTPVVDIAATYVGQTSITTLGTITTGTWNASTITVPFGGTGSTSFNINGVVISGTTTTSPLTSLTLTNGQLVIGSTGNPPVANTLTAGTGISITNGAGSITINSTGGGFTWNDVTTATQTLSVANGYVTDRGAGVTYTLPATANFGDMIWVAGKLGAWTIAQNANQQILVGSASSTVGVTGSVASTNVGDCVLLLCTTSGASTVWRALNFVGNLTVS